MDQGGQEAILIVRPPALFTEKGYMPPDVFFVPQKSGVWPPPFSLWGTCRDETMEGFQIEAQDAKEQVRRFHLQALQSEPNLWKVLEVSDESHKLYGGWSDIFICSSQPILEAIKNKVRETWKTPTPEYVSEHPIRFLGMEVSKKKGKERSGM